jgi:serine/threonine protein kinase
MQQVDTSRFESNEHDDLVGSVVLGKYRIERRLGEGGMGVVFAAEQIPLKRTVALKLMKERPGSSHDSVADLLREAQLLSSIDHEAIVRVFDVGRTDDGRPFMVLEHLEGVSLKRLLHLHGPLPWRWVAQVGSQVLAALEAMHDAGITHLDVKPSNCFCLTRLPGELPQLPRIKLIDFGIARLFAADSGVSTAVGTPAYWAPEQAAGHTTDARTDLFAFGVTLYELLCGELPKRLAREGPINDGLSHRLRPPSAVNPAGGIPPALDALVLKSLSNMPSERYESAGALARELAKLRGESADATRTSPVLRKLDPTPSEAGPATHDDSAQLERVRIKVETFWVDGVLSEASRTGSLAQQRRTLEFGLVGGLGSMLESASASELPREQSVADLFERHQCSMLIVGTPGTGKTTQLLLLAKHLLRRSHDGPVPMVFTLSTWSPEQRTLEDWLVSELYAQYQVPRNLAKRWLAAKRLLPLLDGLDEVAVEWREQCVASINEFIEKRSPARIAVTTRVAEYSGLKQRLHLNVALRFHDLTEAELAELVAQRPDQLGWLTQANLPELCRLAQNPLVLSLLGEMQAPPELPAGAAADLDTLWDQYVERAMARPGKRKLSLERQELVTTLEQLAFAMKRVNQTIFQLDDLQPQFLTSKTSIVAYNVASRIAGASVAGAGVVLSFGLTPLDNLGFKADLHWGLVLGASTGLACGLAHALLAATWFHGRDQKRFSTGRHRVRGLVVALLIGTVNAAVVGFGRHPVAAFLGFEVAAASSPLLWPHAGTAHLATDVRPVETLRFSWRRLVRALPWAGVAALVAAVLTPWEKGPHAGAVVVCYVFVMWCLFSAMRGREVAPDAVPNGAIRRSIRAALGLGGVGFVLTAVATGSLYGLSYGCSAGLTTAAFLWLWYGGYAAVQHGLLRALIGLEGYGYCSARFLNAAADRGLLHRVGSGFMFIHPLLLDRMARRFRRIDE